MAFSPDGKTLATGTGFYKNRGRIFQLRQNETELLMQEEVRAAALSLDGSVAATYTKGRGVQIFSTKTGTEKSRFSVEGEVRSLAFGTDSRLMAVGAGWKAW